MKRHNDNIKEFKNGNLSIKFDPDVLEDIRTGHTSAIEIMSYTLDRLDCYIIGDEFCLSNFDSGCLVYNLYSDYVYILSFGDLYNKLENGHTIKLYAKSPDDEDRKTIDEYFN